MASYDRGRNAVRVGVLAAVSILVFAAMFAWITERGLSRRRSEILVRMPTAERLKKGDPVLLRGVRVGEVASLDFGPDADVLVRLRLKRRVPLARSASAELQAVDLFGSQSVVLRSGDGEAPPLADGDTLAASAAPTLTGRAERLAASAERIAAGAERVVGDTTRVLVRAALADAAAAGTEMQQLLEAAGSILSVQGATLSAATADLAATAEQIRRATSGEELAGTLENLEDATANLAGMTAHAESATASLASILAKLDRGEGTTALLLNDPALYLRLSNSLAALDSLLVDVRRNPKRYVDLSIF